MCVYLCMYIYNLCFSCRHSHVKHPRLIVFLLILSVCLQRDLGAQQAGQDLQAIRARTGPERSLRAYSRRKSGSPCNHPGPEARKVRITVRVGFKKELEEHFSKGLQSVVEYLLCGQWDQHGVFYMLCVEFVVLRPKQ